jgi:hypothetical protein
MRDALESLDNATKNYVNVLFNYEFKLAKLLGFGIDIQGMIGESIENQAKSLYFNKRFSPGDIKALGMISQGNFNALMCLNISKSSEKNIDDFFENYFKSHLDHVSSSKTRKIFNKSA